MSSPNSLLTFTALKDMVTPLLHEKFYGEKLDSSLRTTIRNEVTHILQGLTYTGYMLSLPESPMPIPLMDLRVDIECWGGDLTVNFSWCRPSPTSYLKVELKVSPSPE